MPVRGYIIEKYNAMTNAYTCNRLVQEASALDMDLQIGTEKKGLGTPATRAAIIEKLIQSGFVKREKKNLVPEYKVLSFLYLRSVLHSLPVPSQTAGYLLCLSLIHISPSLHSSY